MDFLYHVLFISLQGGSWSLKSRLLLCFRAQVLVCPSLGAGGAVCRLVRMPPFSFCGECPPSVSGLVGGVGPASGNGVGLLGAGRGAACAMGVKKTGRASDSDIIRK